MLHLQVGTETVGHLRAGQHLWLFICLPSRQSELGIRSGEKIFLSLSCNGFTLKDCSSGDLGPCAFRMTWRSLGAWGREKAGAVTLRYLQHLCIRETSIQICSGYPSLNYRSSSADLHFPPEVRSRPRCAWASCPASHRICCSRAARPGQAP